MSIRKSNQILIFPFFPLLCNVKCQERFSHGGNYSDLSWPTYLKQESFPIHKLEICRKERNTDEGTDIYFILLLQKFSSQFSGIFSGIF
jgi:hypothetical protein